MRLHHIGYAVSDMEASEPSFVALGFSRRGGVVDDDARHVRILFMESPSGELVELVAPLDGSAPVEAALDAHRGAAHPYHLCYEVASLEDEVSRLCGLGFARISDLSEAPALGGRRVCFLMSRVAGLIELVES